jgi:hypothetical protein
MTKSDGMLAVTEHEERNSAQEKRSLRALLVVAIAALLSLVVVPATALALPDGRGYEVVTPAQKNSVFPGSGIPSTDGSAVNWEAIGGCCGAPTAAVTLYQSERQPTGWLTSVLTPTPSEPLVGLFQEQAPMDMSSDLSESIFLTPASFDPGDDDDNALDLYMVSSLGGTPTWISQGSVGGTSEDQSTLGLATRDFDHIAFTSHEALTPDAASQPLTTDGTAQYLYVRDVSAGTTTLVNVDNSGNLVDSAGAILGNAGFPGNQYIPANYTGTSRNAISSDGTKVFFETPPENSFAGHNHSPHLYMRDLSTDTTTALDDPSQVETAAHFEGASDDGSLVFFTTTQGLDGAPTDNELYGFNTDTLTRFRVSAGDGDDTGNVVGETAISNDGSHVFFVAKGVLASNTNSQGATATADQPNFYDYDTTSGTTTFIGTLDDSDINGQFGGPCCLVEEPDVNRPAVPTANGSVLVFSSAANFTDENPAGPSTTVDASASSGDATITVADSSGFIVGRAVQIGPSFFLDKQKIKAIPDSTHITLNSGVIFSHDPGESVDQLPAHEIYRYQTSDGALDCVSCPPPGTDATGDASLGQAAGGAYGPIGVPMNSNGTEIFFQTPDPLVPQDVNTNAPPSGPFGFVANADVYEWHNGAVDLISDGTSAGTTLGSTNPSGNDVIFGTSGALVPQDVDTFGDIYDARVGGGIPFEPPPPPCQGDACKPPPSTPPPNGDPGSSGFSGPGNQPKDTSPGATSKHKKKKCKAKKGKKCKKSKGGKK